MTSIESHRSSPTDSAAQASQHLQTALLDAMQEIISIRDDTLDCCTDASGEYDDPADQDEVERLDQLIDRCRRALEHERS